MVAAESMPPIPETIDLDIDGIPLSLRSLNQFVVWAWEYQPNRTKPYTKVPYNPRSPKHHAKANTNTTWGSFTEAYATYQTGNFAGIGFVLSPDDPYGFVDLDNCRNPVTFVITPWAQSIIDLFRGKAVIELSPSGTGIKIIGQFVWPDDRTHVFRLEGGQIEVFDRDKYTTLTGALLTVSGEEPGPIQDEVNQIIDLYFPHRTKEEPVTNLFDRTPLDIGDEELINLIVASRQGDKFRRLYFDGSLGDYQGNHSAGDAALCSMLAFWTIKDRSRIDQMFRASALMRPKWNEKRRDSTYGWDTVDKAIAWTGDTYAPRDPGARPQPPRAKKAQSGPEEVHEVWADPIDLEPVADAPRMPWELLPAPLSDWILDAADRTSIFPEMIAAPALVAASSVVGRAIGIRPSDYDDFVAIPNLWGALIQPPGSMKSSAIDEGMRFVKRLAAQATETFQQSKDNAESAIELIDDKIAEARRRRKIALKTDEATDDIDALIRELKEQRKQTAPHERRYLTHDATVEKIAEILTNNPRGLLILRDELHGLLRSFDKSGREEDRTFYLEGWNGNGTFSSDRIGRGTIHVNDFALSIFGSIQPGRIRGLIEESTSGGDGNDGLLQRFQIAIWPGNLPKWSKPVGFRNSKASDQAFKVFQFLDNIEPSGLGASRNDADIPYLPFTPGAQIIMDRWRQELEDRLRGSAFDGMPAYLSHMSKYRSLMPSLALLLHLFDVASGASDKTPVTEAPTELAIAWCTFLESHVRKIYDVEVDQGKQAARLLLIKINEGAIVDGQSVREIYRHHWGGLSNDEMVMRGIAVLTKSNIVRTESGATGGRPTQVLRINPAYGNEAE